MALQRIPQGQVVGSPDHATSEAEISTTRPRRPSVVHSGESPSFFNRASSATIGGGQFINIGRQENNPTHVVINVATAGPAGSSGEARASHQGDAQENRTRNINIPLTIQRRTSFPGPSRILGALVRVIRRRPRQREIQPASGIPMERNVFEIYKRHMIPKGFGHPLWIPQSNMRLPVPYRKTGVSIGDVGIITREGAFDCLFNICLPRDHPINSLVPDNFVPLDPPLEPRYHIIELREFSSNGYLASNDVYADRAHPSSINFMTSASDGAILTMPRGAYVQRLANDKHFNNYIVNNAESWYRFANGRLTRGVQNGDLRIVLGCHKSTTWGMATFANRTQYTPEAQSLRFNAVPHYYNPTILHYFWEASGPVMAKVGPEPGDNDGLFDNQSQELRNQCLFIQMQTVTLAEEAWSKVSQHTMVGNDEQSRRSSGLSQQDVSPRRASGGVNDLIPTPRSLVGSRGRQSSVIIGNLEKPPPDVIDHSKAINHLLLLQDKDLRVAITEEKDWCRVLGQNEFGRVNSSDLLARIQHKNNVYKTSNGLVGFELKDQNPEKSPVLSTGCEAPNLLKTLQQGQVTVKDILLGNLPNLQQLDQVLRLAYISHSNEAQDLPPFLMEISEDLFVFDKILESLQTEDDLALSVLKNADNHISTKSQLYQALNAPGLIDLSRRKYFKALGDISWKRYLQFDISADLDEAIWLYGKAISLTPTLSIQSLVPIFGLCSALYRRFYLKRNLRDLVHLARYVQQQDMVDFEDLIDRLTNQKLTDHPTPLSRVPEFLSKPKEYPIPYLKLRPTEGWSGIPTGNWNIPGPKNIIETEQLLNIFAQLEEVSVPLEVQYDNPPSHISMDQGDSKFDALHALTRNWVEQKSPDFSVLWLYGPSAMGLVSRIVQQRSSGIESHIASSFTFSDKAAWNNEAFQVFPTIAVELAFSIPGLLEQYRDILANEHSRKLMTASLGIQFWGLIVDPILKLPPPTEHSRTVIINGVDSCDYHTARIILTIITDALVEFNLPLRFIITSNRDTRIQDVFNLPSLSKISRQFFVGTQPGHNSPMVENDPTDILRRGFNALLSRHPTLSIPLTGGKEWPADVVVDTLVKRSHRNGVYANTVINFLHAVGDNPKALKANLELVLEPTPPSSTAQELTTAFADLDILFTRILSTHADPSTLVHVLGTLLVLHDCAQPQTILQNIFCMSAESFSSVFQVLQSLMHFPKVENDHPWRAVMRNVPNEDQRVKSPFLVLVLLSLSTAMPTAFTIPLAFRDRVHDSFYDFLVNPERSGRFYIDIPYFHGLITMAGFVFVTRSMWRPYRPDLRRYAIFSPETLDYLKFHLQDHFAQCSESVREQVLEQLEDTLKAVVYNYGGRTNQSSETMTSVDDFLINIAVLIDMIINHWDSFGEWSHFTDKHKHKGLREQPVVAPARSDIVMPDSDNVFRRAMNSIRDDLFPRRTSLGLRLKLSGKFRPESHASRDRVESISPLFPTSASMKGATTFRSARAGIPPSFSP